MEKPENAFSEIKGSRKRAGRQSLEFRVGYEVKYPAGAFEPRGSRGRICSQVRMAGCPWKSRVRITH